jgi:Domain of Unknown Function with PDB structure (DUF3857)/Transglutaminase-like superfamily
MHVQFDSETKGRFRLTSKGCALRLLILSALLLLAVKPLTLRADTFTAPTKEEISMTSLPGYPGAAAVVLYREEITKDDLHVVQHYERVKILTEEGKKYANVELNYASRIDRKNDIYEDKSVGDIQARTIHADGTIIPFTGKPYLKTIEKSKEGSYQSKVFTLPDVEVGSIIEYRYSTRYNDEVYESPDWLIQGDLYIKQAHYLWYPTQRDMVDGDGNLIRYITWVPMLPEGAKLERHETPGSGVGAGPQQTYELNIKDVKPEVEEEFMPPIANFSYRVLFNFTAFSGAADFWKANGKRWSKAANSFMDQNSDLKAATQSAIAGASSQDDQLKHIYAVVMAMENTDYTREHDKREDKAAGLGKLKTAGDLLSRKRGDSTELTELFVAMARAAGMKAYVMLVPDRSKEVFLESWTTFRQFDDVIAIVQVDGKEKFFDPGERFCPYGSLAWQHTIVEGLRQADGGTVFANTPDEPYTANKTLRVANLTMGENAEATGKVDMSFIGAPALRWRHVALRGDEEEFHHDLEKAMEKMLPKSMDVKVLSVQNAEDYNKPLMVSFSVKGPVGTPTGKRLIMPVDIFTSGSTATFPHEKRELPVYFHYAEYQEDATRINLPANLAVEGVPTASKLSIPNEAIYSMDVAAAPNSVTTRRKFASNELLVKLDKYPELRTFYSQFESKDQESVVLKVNSTQAAAQAPSAGK